MSKYTRTRRLRAYIEVTSFPLGSLGFHWLKFLLSFYEYPPVNQHSAMGIQNEMLDHIDPFQKVFLGFPQGCFPSNFWQFCWLTASRRLNL